MPSVTDTLSTPMYSFPAAELTALIISNMVGLSAIKLNRPGF
ncbi:MAG TPA: hypothetical protein VMS92_12535 [Mycobacterium sp.]|nr:hypothetical protein [Mycobacterium sp.]